MFLWVYLVFFNGLWVVVPLYALYHGFVDMKEAFMVRSRFIVASLEMQRKEKEEKRL
jgi:hypothetical protein